MCEIWREKFLTNVQAYTAHRRRNVYLSKACQQLGSYFSRGAGYVLLD